VSVAGAAGVTYLDACNREAHGGAEARHRCKLIVFSCCTHASIGRRSCGEQGCLPVGGGTLTTSERVCVRSVLVHKQIHSQRLVSQGARQEAKGVISPSRDSSP